MERTAVVTGGIACGICVFEIGKSQATEKKPLKVTTHDIALLQSMLSLNVTEGGGQPKQAALRACGLHGPPA